MRLIYYLFLLVNTYFIPYAFAQKQARGTVYLDANRNGIRDKGENPVSNICVSNGKEVVQTDNKGEWSLPAGEDTGIFVIKPSGYQLPMNETMIPRHYYLHKPKGSPVLPVQGVSPTGPLPKSIDFPIWRQEENNTFKALIFSDTQARGLKEVNYMTHDVVEECIGQDAIFGVTLGDIVADDPNLFLEISASIAQIGIPWYNVFGNHDNNRSASEDRYTDETFERYFGPSTYAFEYGEVVFIALNNVFFDKAGKYKAHFREEQIEFVRNYLNYVPQEKLIVMMMHIPIVACDNRRNMFEIIEKRPHTLSIAGHTHEQAHLFLNKNRDWQGSAPHHHFINGAVSGSWWCGIKDEMGIPHTTMNDGSPNGYAIFSFTGNTYDILYKAARRPTDYQMNIYLPDDIPQSSLDTTKVLVNVFSGSERSVVEMQFDKNDFWLPLNMIRTVDPKNAEMYQLSAVLDEKVKGKPLEEVFGWKMDPPSKTNHIWEAKLPANLIPGTHIITVRTKDMFGKAFTSHRIFRVR